MRRKPLTRPLSTYSRRHLRRYHCGLCELRADRVARGDCGAIWPDTREMCARKREDEESPERRDAT